jgi:hypothetical protein
MASISSWLLLAAADGAGGGGAGLGGGAGAGAGFAAACAAGIADGGMSFMTGLAGGGGAGFSGGGADGFSAAAGLASSSAMMRRIDARISSIEGSWTFAGCVISDSTSKPLYTKPRRIRRFRICGPGFSSPQARLVPRSSPPDASRGADSPQHTAKHRGQRRKKSGANRSTAKGTVCQGNN